MREIVVSNGKTDFRDGVAFAQQQLGFLHALVDDVFFESGPEIVAENAGIVATAPGFSWLAATVVRT